MAGRTWREGDADELLMVADDEGRYLEVNDRAVEVLGYTREELLRMSVFDLTPSAAVLDGLELWQKFFRTGEQTGEYALRARGGRLLRFSYRARVDPETHRNVSWLRLLGEIRRD